MLLASSVNTSINDSVLSCVYLACTLYTCSVNDVMLCFSGRGAAGADAILAESGAEQAQPRRAVGPRQTGLRHRPALHGAALHSTRYAPPRCQIKVSKSTRNNGVRKPREHNNVTLLDNMVIERQELLASWLSQVVKQA